MFSYDSRPFLYEGFFIQTVSRTVLLRHLLKMFLGRVRHVTTTHDNLRFICN